MGQQQLLLIILVTVIVGIATVVAINVFGTSLVESNRDAIRKDLFIAGTNVQQIWARPLAINGTANDFNNLNNEQLLSRLNIIGNYENSVIENENGIYSLVSVGTSEIRLVSEPKSNTEDIEIIVCFNSTNREWLFKIGPPNVDKPSQCD